MWSEMTLEPAIFAYQLSNGIDKGAGIQTRLELWKVCSVVKGYNETVCSNLQAQEYDHIQTEVQIYRNEFAIKVSRK